MKEKTKHLHSFIRSWLFISVVLLTGVLLLSHMSCGTKSMKATLPLDSLNAFSYNGEQPAPSKWWTVFEDETLNNLVDSALSHNFNIQTAWQRLRAAEAIVDRESAAFFPTLDAFARGEVSRSLSEFDETNNFRLGLASSYEVDLWGRIRSRAEAERFRAMASYADYQAASLSLSAEVVRTWYRLAEARNELDLVSNQIDTNEKVLNLIRARFGSGQTRSVDILRQQQLVEATREQKIAIESRIQVLEHRLIVLLGRQPQIDTTFKKVDIPSLPSMPATGIPGELIQRRPDVQTAYHVLQAADRDLAAAVSNQYPRLSLSASVSTAANNVNNLFDEWAYALAGNLTAPLFYGGELSAEVDRNEAVKKQRLYEYGQVVLSAFQEVEDALIQEKKQVESIESLEQQVDLARKAYQQLRVEYFNGLSDYLDVLTALDREQQLRRNLLQSRLLLLEYRIALYRALAGGFQTKRETTEE